MQGLDFPYGVIAILLGVFFMVAKLDAQGRKAGDFPHVPPAEFERWRNWTTSIYRLGAGACFLRVLFQQGFGYYISRQTFTGPALPASLRYPALLVDLLWLAVVAATFVRAGRARALRRELGIVLSPMTPQQQAATTSAESDEAAAKDEPR